MKGDYNRALLYIGAKHLRMKYKTLSNSVAVKVTAFIFDKGVGEVTTDAINFERTAQGKLPLEAPWKND